MELNTIVWLIVTALIGLIFIRRLEQYEELVDKIFKFLAWGGVVFGVVFVGYLFLSPIFGF